MDMKVNNKKIFLMCFISIVSILSIILVNSLSKSYGAEGNTYGVASTDNSKDLDIIAIDPDPCNSSVSGDAVLLVSDGYVMLMDTGHGTDGTNDIEYVSDYVINFLSNYQAEGKLKGFYMYFSHFHADHYGLIYNSFEQNGTCESIEGAGSIANSFNDKSGKFVDRLKQTIDVSKIKEIYVSDVSILNNIFNKGESIGYYRNNYAYLTQTFCEGETTTVQNSESGCTVYPINLCKNGNKVKILKKGDKVLLGDAIIDIVGPNYINTLDFSSANTQTDYKNVFDLGYPICNNIPSGKRNYKTTNITCTIDGKTRYDFSLENTGSETTEKGDYLNDSSLVSLVTVGNTRYLSTGDIEWQEIEKLVSMSSSINPSGKPIDIIKVPHHAEKTGFLESLYTTYKPKFAFYQQNNGTYGGKEWSKYVIDYVSKNTNLLATGYNGTIKYKISNDNINIENDSYLSTCKSKENNNKIITVNYIDSTTKEKISDSNKYIVAKNSLGEEMTKTNNYYENETHDYDGNYNLKEIANKDIVGYVLKKDTNYNMLEGLATDITSLDINLEYEKAGYVVTIKYIDESENKILNTKKISLQENESFNINNYKEEIKDYKLNKVELPNNLESLKEDYEVKLYYISTKDIKINIPDTLRNSKKYLIGFIIIIIGLLMVSETLLKKDKK